MSAPEFYNTVEIYLWALVGLGVLVIAIRRKGSERRRLLVLALAFFVFSLSDDIEIQTGAWWRPLWLLFLKAACVAVFLLAFRRHLQAQAAARKADSGNDSPPPASP